MVTPKNTRRLQTNSFLPVGPHAHHDQWPRPRLSLRYTYSDATAFVAQSQRPSFSRVHAKKINSEVPMRWESEFRWRILYSGCSLRLLFLQLERFTVKYSQTRYVVIRLTSRAPNSAPQSTFDFRSSKFGWSSATVGGRETVFSVLVDGTHGKLV